MKELKNKKLVLSAIAREMNFWYDVSLKTDSEITKEEAEKKIIGLHEAYMKHTLKSEEARGMFLTLQE